MPSRISDKDILSMFNGLLALLREKVEHDQMQKLLNLKMKYSRLKALYNKSRNQVQRLNMQIK